MCALNMCVPPIGGKIVVARSVSVHSVTTTQAASGAKLGADKTHEA